MFRTSRIRLLTCTVLVSILLLGYTSSVAAYVGGNWKTEAIVTDLESEPQLNLNSELFLRGSQWIGNSRFVAEVSARVNRLSNRDWETRTDVERLYLSTYFPTFDLIVGKQQISWGTGRAWSPSDIFNPPNPFDPDGRRQGVTAAVVRIPHGPLSFSSLVVADNKDSDKLSWGARYHGYVSGTDWSVFYANKNAEPIIGGDIATDFLGLGVHSELTWEPEFNQDGRLLWLAGLDYSWLDGKLLWLGEYLYNSASKETKHSLFNQLSYAYSEFNSVSLNLLSNLVDNSQVVTLQHHAMLSSQWEWTVGGSYFFGDEDTQYGMAPTDYLIQTGLKYSF